VALGGDGQVTIGETVVKSTARKIRSLLDGKVLCGFAGSAADALALVDLFEAKLKEFQGSVPRAAVELVKKWRTDKFLRPLQGQLVVVDAQKSLLLSGGGDIIEPDDGVVGIGSGGAYAVAAARALMKHTQLGPKEIVQASLEIAADICIYTNHSIVVEEL
jgi:ATP-dependent HslUV protease subunit HslV